MSIFLSYILKRELREGSACVLFIAVSPGPKSISAI